MCLVVFQNWLSRDDNVPHEPVHLRARTLIFRMIGSIPLALITDNLGKTKRVVIILKTITAGLIQVLTFRFNHSTFLFSNNFFPFVVGIGISSIKMFKSRSNKDLLPFEDQTATKC